MYLNFADIISAHSGAKDRLISESAVTTERRIRTRTKVRWPVLVFRDDGKTRIETVTENLSSTGFYCFSSGGFTPGERLFCQLRVPTHDPHNYSGAISLECRVVVMRSELMPDGSFGTACRIEDYQLAAVR
jgi:hypothetical protein